MVLEQNRLLSPERLGLIKRREGENVVSEKRAENRPEISIIVPVYKAEKSMAFGEMLKRRTGLEVVMWDERLTTVEAERTLIENKVRREDRKKYIDKIAAVFILQGYLDSLAHTPLD